jgi:2-polyprenyl-3-methyl-5-hydroxy-6-metoxy-1,4-benzoquinol methylase
MELNELQKNWNQFGKQDPLWAILTQQDKKGNKWTPDEFFETGRQEIAYVMEYVKKLGLLQQRGRALDFGCGVGRLTQALASYFDEVVGIDIAPSMVRLAKQYNRFGAGCAYRVNDRDDLSLFSGQEFHFIYTNMVLQHMKPEYAKSYIKEFLRVLKPEGVLIFQLPSRNLGTPRHRESTIEAVPSPETPSIFVTFKQNFKRNVPEVLWRWYVDLKYPVQQPVMQMYGIERSEVESSLKGNGARIVDVVRDGCAGDTWEGFRYCVTKI